jgi:hypothetical protein
MEDPFEGWRMLVNLLRPGGIMCIGLYSELARAHVVKARQIIKEAGVQPTPESIRRFRRDVFSLKYPELNYLKLTADMYSASSCRDLLFHVQEWRFSVDKIKQYLAQLGLIFVGFTDIDNAKQEFRKMFPNDISLTNLDNWSEFEQRHPDTFALMYNMVVQKPQLQLR